MLCYKKVELLADDTFEVNGIGIFGRRECTEEEEMLAVSAADTWHIHYGHVERMIANNDNGIDSSSYSEETYVFAPEECIIDSGEVIGFYHGDIYLFSDTQNHVKRTSKYEESVGPYGEDVENIFVASFVEKSLGLDRLLRGRARIKDKEFQMLTGIRSIRIPSYVTHVGTRAFLGCRSLTEVDIPDNVKTVGSGAFFSCIGIQSVSIGKGLAVIPEECFQYCENISSVKLSEGVECIEDSAFAFARALESVELPDSIRNIASNAFYRCNRLRYVVLPKGASVRHSSFRDCGDVDVYYKGTPEDWEQLKNSTSGNVYYYSETKPESDGLWWRYVCGSPEPW